MIDDAHREGDELLERVLGGASDGEVVNNLLKQFFRGYPVERLCLLLASGHRDAVKAGTWIAAELGTGGAASLTQELTPLLEHPEAWVRHSVLDAVLLSASEDDGATVAKAVARMEDPTEGVRRTALNLLARASVQQLAPSVPFLDDARLRALVSWLVDPERGADEVIARLDAEDRLTRMFAAAAAVRVASDDETALERASAAPDTEVSKFAREELGRLSIMRREAARRRRST